MTNKTTIEKRPVNFNLFNPCIVAEIEVRYYPTIPKSERKTIFTSLDSFNALMEIWDKGKISMVEHFYIILMNRANKVIGIEKVSEGGVNGCMADAKKIFHTAINCMVSGIILAHNHPSGNLQPSQSDRDLTRNLIAGGKHLEIVVADHLIVTGEQIYFSFADERLI